MREQPSNLQHRSRISLTLHPGYRPLISPTFLRWFRLAKIRRHRLSSPFVLARAEAQSFLSTGSAWPWAPAFAGANGECCAACVHHSIVKQHAPRGALDELLSDQRRSAPVHFFWARGFARPLVFSLPPHEGAGAPTRRMAWKRPDRSGESALRHGPGSPGPAPCGAPTRHLRLTPTSGVRTWPGAMCPWRATQSLPVGRLA